MSDKEWEVRNLTPVTACGPWLSGGANHLDGKQGGVSGGNAGFSSGHDKLYVSVGHLNGIDCIILEPERERERELIQK